MPSNPSSASAAATASTAPLITANNKRVLVADLPMMWPSDFYRFEREGGIWGKQFRIRRQQLSLAAWSAGLTMAVSAVYVIKQKNTAFALVSTLSGFGIFGFCVGIAGGNLLYDHATSLSEVSMMRRVWWAKECAKNFDYSQISKDKWKAQYPHAKLPH